MRVVTVERKECRRCNLKGWAGDNIYEDGVFNYNGNVVVELSILYAIRRAVSAGQPVSTWVKIFLEPLLDDMEWLSSEETLANR